MQQKRAEKEILDSTLYQFFESYVKYLKELENLEEKKRLQETRLVFRDESLSVLEFYKKTRQLEKKIEKFEEKIEAAKESVSKTLCSQMWTSV